MATDLKISLNWRMQMWDSFARFAAGVIARAELREPDFVIGEPGQPYLRRWWLLPRNPLFNIYLHQIIRSDQDRELHCHPWWNLSIILRGLYYERMPLDRKQSAELDEDCCIDKLRAPMDVVIRRGGDRHRLIVDGAPCWSLFITGPRYRTWGFHCRKGFVPWFRFVDPSNHGKVGRGCGEMS